MWTLREQRIDIFCNFALIFDIKNIYSTDYQLFKEDFKVKDETTKNSEEYHKPFKRST